MKAVAAISCGLIVVGCATQKPVKNAESVLAEYFNESPSLVFRAWNGGPPQGADCHTELTLRSDGAAVLDEYGFSLHSCEGRFSVTNASQIILSLENYTNWPAMVLAVDQSDFDLVGPIHYVVIGDDVSLGVDNEA